MRLRLKGIIAHRAEMTAHDVAVLVDTIGDFIQRQVRNRRQFPGKLLVRRLRRQFELRHGGLEFGDLGHQRGGARVIPGLLGVADLL